MPPPASNRRQKSKVQVKRPESLVEAVRQANSSARLRILIETADRENALPSLSVHDFFENRQQRVLEFLEMPGMEDDLFSELMVVLFDTYSHYSRQYRIESPTARAFNMSIAQVVNYSPSSTRLKNAISDAARRGLLPHASLHEYAQAGPDAMRAYESLSKIGNRLKSELEELLNNTIKRLASSTDDILEYLNPIQWPSTDYLFGPDETQWKARIAELQRLDPAGEQHIKPAAFQIGLYWPDNLSTVRIRDFYGTHIDEALNFVRPGLTEAEFQASTQTLMTVLDECMQRRRQLTVTLDSKYIFRSLLGTLTLRESDVIDQRYGITDERRKTLQHIANRFGLTRERVRQIEASALETLKEPLRLADLKLYLHASRNATAEVLLGSEHCASVKAIEERYGQLNGMTKLAVDCCHGGNILNYADANYKFHIDVYYMLDIPVERLGSELGTIESAIHRIDLPANLEHVASQINVSTDAVRIYAASSQHMAIYRNCIYQGKLTPRTRRAINILHIAMTRFEGNAVPFNQLYSTYLSVFPEDQCSDRDLRIVFSSFGHLFINLTDAGYWIVNRYSLLPRPESTSSLRDSELYKPASKGTLQTALVELTNEIGPAPLLEIRKEFTRRYPKWSRNSVFALLSDRPYFIRMAPGVMGTVDSSCEPEDVERYEFMFTKRQVLYYILARLSDARFDYPLWIPALEYAWCRWGEINLPRDLFNALLYVSNPHTWAVSAHERDQWLSKIEQHSGKVAFSPPPVPYSKTPTLKKTAAVAFFAADKPTLSWMDINRVIGRRIDDRVSLNYAALMDRIGILTLPGQWHAPIEVNSTAAYRFVNEVACDNLFENGWEQILRTADASGPNVDWIDSKKVDRMIQHLA